MAEICSLQSFEKHRIIANLLMSFRTFESHLDTSSVIFAHVQCTYYVCTAAWSVVSTFMSKEQKGKIMMVGKKDIGKYLSDDVRSNWPHMV